VPRHDPRATPAAQRTLLFDRLATLERAGIAPLEALPSLARDADPRLTPAIRHLIRQLRDGRTLTEAGRVSGLWRPWEIPVIQAGESGGRLGDSFQRLADYYRRQADRWRRLRGKLLLPALTLLIGVLVGPLPALVGGNIGAAGYLARVVLPLLVLGGLLMLLRHAYQGLLAGGDQPLAALLGRLALIRQLRQRDRIAALGLLLDSDLPPDQAFTVLAANTPDRDLRARLQRAGQAVATGASFTDTLVNTGLLDDPVGPQLLQSGEQAGRLPEMLHRYRERLDEALDRSLDSLTAILPWLVYAAVIAWVIF